MPPSDNFEGLKVSNKVWFESAGLLWKPETIDHLEIRSETRKFWEFFSVHEF